MQFNDLNNDIVLTSIKKMLMNIIFSVIITMILLKLGVEGSNNLIQMAYNLVYWFLIWICLESLVQDSFIYILFLLLITIPIQNWIIRTGNSFDFSIGPVIINTTLIATIIFLIRIIILNKSKLRIDKTTSILFFIVVLFANISLFYTSEFVLSFNGIIYGLLIPYMISLFIINIIKNKKDLMQIYDVIIYCILFYNILSYIMEITNFFSMQEKKSTRFSGIFANPNFYSPVLVVSILMCIYLFLYYKENAGSIKIRYILMGIFSLYILLLTGTRSGLVILGFGLIIFFMKLKITFQKLLLIEILVVGILIFLLFFNIRDILTNSNLVIFQRISLLLEEGFTNDRYSIWIKAINYIRNNFLLFRGIGFGVMTYEQIGWTTPHNSFLYLTMTIGLLGSILYHIIIISKINLKCLFSRGLDDSFSSIILLALLANMLINGYRILIIREPDLPMASLGVHFDVILLGIFIGVSYSLNNKYESELTHK